MATTIEATRAPHHVILALRVTGGFLGGAHLEFVDGLNCLIGGRGAGKTTALEFLRFGLGLMPDAKLSSQRYRTIDALVKANLGGGRLSVDVRTKSNIRYTAGRAATETIQVVNEQGVVVPISLDRDQIFGADVFSQNEIEEIASSAAAQLELLDRFREPEAIAIAEELAQLQLELDQSTVELRRIAQVIIDLRGKASEVLVIEERLKGLVATAGPDAAKLNAAHHARAIRAKEERLPRAAFSILTKVERDINHREAELQVAIDSLLTDDVRKGGNRDVVASLEADISSVQALVGESHAAIVRAVRNAETRIREHETVLTTRHATQEAEYRSMLAESEEEGGRSAERQVLQTALADAEAAFRAQQASEKRRNEMLETRQMSLRLASELRDRRFAIRKEVAERLTNQFPVLRVTVQQAAGLERYCNLLTELLRGAGMRQGQIAARLSEAFLPTELSQIVVANDAASLIDRSGLDKDRAQRVLDALRCDGAFYEIETVDMDDRPSVELKDGDRFKESSQLSTGQRCTTILPILLVQSERPLLIDQPEDNLDNAFVYETVVTALRAVKGSRQVIFVTHNPNIPVLGEAERVFVFSSDGQHSALQQVGTVDECKANIERILEGGEEAFLKRKARYGH